jgi:tetratricopeptide (TPR) repeat protein
VSSFADFQRLIAQTSENPAHASVDLLLGQMDPAAAKHLELCAVPHQFDLAILRLLAPEIEAQQVEVRYQEFSRLSLVIHRKDALALHDEARRFLFDRWLTSNTAEFKLANARLVQHFEKSVSKQNSYDSAYASRQRMFHLTGQDPPKGIQEFERLFRDERAKGRLSECEALLALVREYSSVLTRIHMGIVLYHEARLWFERRDWSRAEELFLRVLEIDALPISYRIKSRNRIGLLFAKQRRWQDAIRNLEMAVQLAKANGQLQKLPFLVHDMGAAYRDSGDPESSRRLLEESIQLAKNVQDISCIAAGYNGLGTLERKGGDIRRAIEQYKKSLEYLSMLRDQLRTAQVYNNLGAAYADLGDWKVSEEMYKKSLELKTEAGDRIGLARTLSNLIPVYQNLNLLQDAISAAQKATAIFEDLRDNFSAAVATRNLAKLYRRMEAVGESKNNYQRAIELFRGANDSEQAEATERELNAYDRHIGMPWWAWAAALFGFVAFIAVIALFVFWLSKQ